MLKITLQTKRDAIRITLEGRLAGPWVAELDQAWERIHRSGQAPLVVDLTGVTFIEGAGQTLLRRMWRDGAELIASGCCNRTIVDHITGSPLRSQSDN